MCNHSYFYPPDSALANSGIQAVENMSYCQATTYKPLGGLTLDRPLGLGRTFKLLPQHSVWQHSSRSRKLQEKVYPKLVVAACHKRLGPVYASSGKDDFFNDVSSFCSFLLVHQMSVKLVSSLQLTKFVKFYLV